MSCMCCSLAYCVLLGWSFEGSFLVEDKYLLPMATNHWAHLRVRISQVGASIKHCVWGFCCHSAPASPPSCVFLCSGVHPVILIVHFYSISLCKCKQIGGMGGGCVGIHPYMLRSLGPSFTADEAALSPPPLWHCHNAVCCPLAAPHAFIPAPQHAAPQAHTLPQTHTYTHPNRYARITTAAQKLHKSQKKPPGQHRACKIFAKCVTMIWRKARSSIRPIRFISAHYQVL